MFFILSNNKILSYDINSPGSNALDLLKNLRKLGEIPQEARIQIDGKLFQDLEWFNILKLKYPDLYSEQKGYVVIEWFYPIKGGFFMETIDAVIGIVKFLLFIPKAFIWIGRLFVWLIKMLLYLLVLFAQVISREGVMGLVKFVTQEIVFLPFLVAGEYIRKFVNYMGMQTVNGWLVGADNSVDDNSGIENSKDTLPSDNCAGGKRKCYRTSEGSVPPTVIIATILFPPTGVFMEYGLHGWMQILICLLLTFVFYFPGLFYALILLYC